jgi:hypothetical protein
MLITLIVEVVVIGLIWWCTTLLPLPEPVPVILKVIFIIILLLVVLQAFGILGGTSLGLNGRII